MLFAVIAVHRRFEGHISRYVLHVSGTCGDDGSIRFHHAHVADLDDLVGAVKTETQQPPLFNPALGLRPNPSRLLASRGTVSVEAHYGTQGLDDRSLLRVSNVC